MSVGGPRDVDEFEEFFDRLFPRAESAAMRIVANRGAAEDVAAEALTRAYARWSRVRTLPYREGWVMRVAINVAIDAVRRRPVTVTVPVTEGPEDLATLRVGLLEAMRVLPKKQRSVIALRFLSDLSEAEVALTLGMAVGTVKSHTHRALAALRRELGRPEEVPLAADSL